MNLAHKVVSLFRIDPLGVAMPGPRLTDRVRAVVESGVSRRISRMRLLSLVAISIALCIAFFAVTLTRAQDSATEDWEKAAGGKRSFDVASVKRNDEPMSMSNHPMGNVRLDDGDAFQPTAGLFSTIDHSLDEYIGFAFKLSGRDDSSVTSQLPGWAQSERFDIQARGPADSTKDQFRLMLQSLLADRFKLALHFETHEGPVYDLVVAARGKMKPYPDSLCDPSQEPTVLCESFILHVPGDGSMQMRGADVTMAQVAQLFENQGRPVIDRTGLKGRFDVEFHWECSRLPTGLSAPPPQAIQDPSCDSERLEAVKDQLGLKLVSAQGPVETVIVDHIEEPTPN